LREILTPLSSKVKKTVLKMVATKVPGRKNMVTAAMVIIAALSRWVRWASSAVNSAIAWFARLSA